MSSLPIDPSEYLLAQFDAIIAFEQGVRRLKARVPPHTVKSWYINGQVQALENCPGLLLLCQDLEKSVPREHPYWSNMLGAS